MTAPLRVLLLSRYGYLGASSRVRMYQYLPLLEAAGIHVTTQALLDDDYLRRLYASGRRRKLSMMRSYWQRARALLTAGRYDLVWLEKECWPWMPAFLDPGLLARRVPYVVDYDDAIFHNYDRSGSALMRALFGRKIDAVMARAAMVIAGNPYLAERATRAGARRIEILPSVVDLERYPPVTRAPTRGVTVGWIGSPASQHLVTNLAPVLKDVLDPRHDRFVTVGANFTAPLLPNHEVRAWREEREAADIAEFDIGVMPLVDEPFERGKCGFKLIQYMAANVATIASPVGVNAQIVQHGVSGYLASSDAQWKEALLALKASPDLRTTMGRAGRSAVERQYSLQVTAPRLAALLRELA